MAVNILGILTRWLVALNCFAATERPGVGQFTVPTAVEEGRRQYEALVAKVPEYGACWSDAVARLERDCDELTEDLQGRLALSFTSCFLEKMGQQPVQCPESQPLSRCRDLSRFLNTTLAPSYVQFFTHTQVICGFLRSRQWQVEAARTISALGASSVRATAELRRAAQAQEMLSRHQRRMLHQGLQLEEKVARSHAMLHEQRHLLDAGLLRIANVQAFFVEQFVTLHALAYYTLAVVLSLLMTASKRTAAARPWLLLLFLANLGMERLLCRWASDDVLNSAAPLAADSPLGQRIALCRQAVCLLALCLYVYQVYSFRDLAALNNQLLLDLQQELHRIRMAAPAASPASPEGGGGEQHHQDATTWRPPPPSSQPVMPPFFNFYHWDESSESSQVSLGSLVEDSERWSPPMTATWWDGWEGEGYHDSYDEDDSSGSGSGSSMAEVEDDYCGLDQLSIKAEPGSELGDKLDDDTASYSSAATSLLPAGGASNQLPTTNALASPPPVLSPADLMAGGRYNLRPRRSLNSSTDAISPIKSPTRRPGRHPASTAQPLAVIRSAAVLSSDEE